MRSYIEREEVEQEEAGKGHDTRWVVLKRKDDYADEKREGVKNGLVLRMK